MLKRLGTAVALTTTLFAGFAADAAAQDPWGDGGGLNVWGPITLEFELREITIIPGGEVAFTVPGGTNHAYNDLFKTGSGFGLQVAMPFFQASENPNSEITIAPILGFDLVTLRGSSNNANGTPLAADDWTHTAIMFGAQMRMRTGGPASPVGFLFGVELAIGPMLYGSVDGTLGGTLTGPIYDSSTSFALRTLFELGVAIRLTDQFNLNVLVYGGIGIYGAPDGNSDPGNAFIDPDPDDLFPFIVGFNISLRMRLPG